MRLATPIPLALVLALWGLAFPATEVRAQESQEPVVVEDPASDEQASREDPAAAKAASGAPAGEIRLATPDAGSSITVTTTEVQTLAGKLAEFGKGLSPQERLMMDWLLQRAGSAPQDDPGGTQVHGSLFTPPLLAAPPGEYAGTPEEDAAGEPGDGVTGEPGDVVTSEPGSPGDEREAASPGLTKITPAPAAALARALGMNLIEMEGGGPQPSR